MAASLTLTGDAGLTGATALAGHLHQTRRVIRHERADRGQLAPLLRSQGDVPARPQLDQR